MFFSLSLFLTFHVILSLSLSRSGEGGKEEVEEKGKMEETSGGRRGGEGRKWGRRGRKIEEQEDRRAGGGRGEKNEEDEEGRESEREGGK